MPQIPRQSAIAHFVPLVRHLTLSTNQPAVLQTVLHEGQPLDLKIHLKYSIFYAQI